MEIEEFYCNLCSSKEFETKQYKEYKELMCKGCHKSYGIIN